MVKNDPKSKNKKKGKNISIVINEKTQDNSLITSEKKPKHLEDLLCDYIIDEFFKKKPILGKENDTMMKLLYLSSRNDNIIKCKNKNCNEKVQYLKKCKCGWIANELF